jgi:hypothetical protein
MVGYKHCAVALWHPFGRRRDVANDFICAAKASALYAQRAGA